MIRYALLPLRGAALILVVSFTIGWLLALRAGLFGVPLGLLLGSWLFKYCFVLLDSMVAGEEEAPVLSIEMVNPVSEQRPLALAGLVLISYWLVGTIERVAGHGGALFASACLAAVLPASIAVLGMTRNPLHAVWPPTLFAFIRGLASDYVWLMVATICLAALLYLLGYLSAPLWLLLAANQWFFLLVFALIGGAAFEHREDLGIESRSRRERTIERDMRDHMRDRRQMLDDAYAQLRMRRSLDSWQLIDRWLASHRGRDTERTEYFAVIDAVSQWDDPKVADRVTCEYIALLLSRRENGAALTVVENRLARNPAFKPELPEQTRRLAELAALAGKRSLTRLLESKS